MSTLEILPTAGIAFVLAAFAFILARPQKTGSVALAAVLLAGFLCYSLLTVAREGLVLFWTNHTANLTGVQVWWDLLLSVTLAFFFMAPRARAAGMNVPLWALFTVSTASIGLLAMAARLFWLEQEQAEMA